LEKDEENYTKFSYSSVILCIAFFGKTLNLTCMKQLICFDTFSVSANLIWKFIRPPLLLTFLISLASAVDINANTDGLKSILPPVAVCKNITVQLGEDGSATITGSDVNQGSYDPDGVVVNLMVAPNTFNCSHIGPNTVTLTVTDNEGLSSECNAIVTVEDKIPPVVNVKPFELVLGSAGTGTLLPADINNGSSDNCGPITLSVSD
jgi:hypothetical protein